MKKFSIKWVLGCSIILLSHWPLCAAEILLDDYREGLNSKWEEKSFKGRTLYEVTLEDNQRCIKATSHASASALYYPVAFNMRDYPILTWRWKVAHVLSRGNALTKEGDDYAARIYVVFPSRLFWKTRALNYVWANRLSQGKAVPNPFTSNNIMIAVESGPAHAGEWVDEKRNIFKDYLRYFGDDPPEVGAIAIMTDTDNTGEETTAWYGPIRLLTGSNN